MDGFHRFAWFWDVLGFVVGNWKPIAAAVLIGFIVWKLW